MYELFCFEHCRFILFDPCCQLKGKFVEQAFISWVTEAYLELCGIRRRRTTRWSTTLHPTANPAHYLRLRRLDAVFMSNTRWCIRQLAGAAADAWERWSIERLIKSSTVLRSLSSTNNVIVQNRLHPRPGAQPAMRTCWSLSFSKILLKSMRYSFSC